MDREWWRIHIDEVRTLFSGQLLTSAAHCYGAKRIGSDEFPNSGAGAIVAAVRFGAKRIVLLGYDCQHTWGQTHWHGAHPKGLGDAVSVGKWGEHFEALARRLKDVEIINCSRETALSCFVRRDLQDALGGQQKPIMIHGMRGLGDNIYQRAFARNLDAEVYLDTPWPQLYEDLPHVHCVRAETRLRTQKKNVEAASHGWVAAPRRAKEIRIGYGHADLRHGSILGAMARQFGTSAAVFDLPDFGRSPVETDRPVAIVRPVTARREWLNTARNPKPEYIAQAADELRRRGYFVVSLADLQDGEEWLVGDPPGADLVLHKGELNITQLLAAVRHAAVVVGGVGWIVPACIAMKTPLYVVLGGQLGHNAPDKITDPAMDLSNVGWAWPARPCKCTSKQHDCEKEIHGFDHQFVDWLDRQNLRGCTTQASGVAA